MSIGKVCVLHLPAARVPLVNVVKWTGGSVPSSRRVT